MSTKAVSILMALGAMFVAGVMLMPVANTAETQPVTYVYASDADYDEVLQSFLDENIEVHDEYVEKQRYSCAVPGIEQYGELQPWAPGSVVVRTGGQTVGVIEAGIFIPTNVIAIIDGQISLPVATVDAVVEHDGCYEIQKDNVSLVLGSDADQPFSWTPEKRTKGPIASWTQEKKTKGPIASEDADGIVDLIGEPGAGKSTDFMSSYFPGGKTPIVPSGRVEG